MGAIQPINSENKARRGGMNTEWDPSQPIQAIPRLLLLPRLQSRRRKRAAVSWGYSETVKREEV